MTLNTGWVEHKGGNFLSYSEGVAAGVANTIENVDRERLAIVQRLELKEGDILRALLSPWFFF
jgi:hypothetical protein